ncbi:DNA primase [Enterococcus sp. JM4C]|uniref:DNA primase family protein n=1 Tax=Candidatus Enterococcus huntleyi TaxID=1857217 RepID=UPI00137A228E|nr:phage/plasmid primase, P4 family [Enterococcus sp. JM4C]KAF1295097.1 DNA primase [Enterococcus sp. JM4C]
MSELINLKELQKKKQEENKELPSWIYFDDKGNMKVSASQLGYEIMKEIPMIRTSELSQGARFDSKTGSWRMDSLSDFLDGYITKNLESVGQWSQSKLYETKKFIFIKIFDSSMKENPFNRSKPYLTNFKNGTYNIKTNEMKPHDTKNYILQSHSYDIDPTTKEVPTKTIEWLEELTGHSYSAKHLMEIIGYCFYRSYEPFQTITILQGTGENGKSTFLNIFNKVLGSDNVSNMTLQDLGNKQNRFASANLFQKEANLFADVDSEFLKSTGLLKALTGGDRLSAEFKGKDHFMFVNFAKLIFSANELPAFNDFTRGFERRLYVVPFDCVIDEAFKKKHDLKAIEAEIPVFAVYCIRMFRDALERKELTISPKMKQAKEKWLKESNHVLRFIEEKCEIDMESKQGDSSKMIYEEYQKFCYQESLRELSQPKFSKQLEKMGIVKVKQSIKGSRLWRYRHLQLKNGYTLT